jgi:hypothetical protein
MDMFTEETIGEVDDLHSFAVTLAPFQGLSLLVLCPGDHLVSSHRYADRPSVR